MRRRITEYLELDLDSEQWVCHNCGRVLGSARENYKRFLLVADRDPREVHNPYTTEGQYDYTLAPDPEWCRLIEFYCPSCATLFEVEYLPPGHPLTWDINLDLDALKAKSAAKQESD